METKLQTINIKGKNYVTVNTRVKAFRTTAEWKGWTLKTIAHILTDDVAVFEAQVLDKDGRVVANGFAREVRTQPGSMVNATSYVENCETSAWGRALGNLGIGIDESICSAQELLVAVGMQQVIQEQQEPAPAAPAKPASVIEPKKEEKQQVQAQRQGLTDRELEEYDAACADMDAAECKEQLLKTFARYKDSNFAGKLLEKAIGICTVRGWEVKQQKRQ